MIVLALSWIIVASIQDLKKREVANWLNFSLIIFALGFRFFYSLFSEVGFGFFYQGLIGLGIFFVLGNAFYYGRMFAGGDAKLFIALGAVLPFSESFLVNVKIFTLFIFLFLFIGGFYGLVWSVVLSLKNLENFKKEFSKNFKKNRKFIYFVLIFGLIIMLAGFYENLFFYVGALIFGLSYFYVYAKTVDECCMTKKIKVKNLREGDWLYKDVKVGKKTIKASWDGLTKDDIIFLRKNKKKVLVRHGIPFVPVFLISFLILVYLVYQGHLGFLWFYF